MTRLEVTPAAPSELREPLRLLEEWLRNTEPVPDEFTEKLRRSVEVGDIELLSARLDGHTAGVLLLAFRPNVSLGGLFASIEDLYVRPESRGRGVGKALLKAADERCRERGVYYVEAQVEENEAETFYAAFGYESEPDVRVFSRSLPIGYRRDEKLKPDG